LRRKISSKVQSSLQRYTGEMKKKLWVEKAIELQMAADIRDLKASI